MATVTSQHPTRLLSFRGTSKRWDNGRSTSPVDIALKRDRLRKISRRHVSQVLYGLAVDQVAANLFQWSIDGKEVLP